MLRKTYRSLLTPINFGLLLLSGFVLFLTGCGRDESEADRGASPTPISTAPSSDSVRTLDPATAKLPTSLTMSPTSGFDGIGLGPGITLARTPEGLMIHSQTADPQFGLPRLRPFVPGKWTVHIQLSSPAATTIEVFYNTTNAPTFDAAHSKKKPLQKGDNDIAVEFTEPDFQGGIRIDPGELPGDYLIKLIEVRSPRDSPAPSQTPGQ